MAADYDDIMNAKKTDTMRETDRKCPQCGATMDFDPTTGGLHCDYCGYREEIKAEDSKGDTVAEEQDFESAEFTGNCDWGVSQKTVTCKSCGAVSVYDALAVANECPYCGSNQVMEASDVKTLAPNGVVLFKITAKQAGEKFTKWLSGKWFAPKEAKRSARADRFKGIYLPYWTFDSDTVTEYTAEYGIDRTEGHGDNQRTVTDWHRTSGTYSEFIDDQLVAGTGDQNVNMLRKVEPFDTKDNKSYKPEYLAGFMAERYSVGLKDAWEKAKDFIRKRLQSAIESKIRSEHNADHVRNYKATTSFSHITYKYLMLPVWLSCFKYKDKVYQFIVNGQSGKVGGDYPISGWRVFIAILIGLVILAILWSLVQ
ncbi:MAG: hypothetical protein J5910_05205 [Lachnospiraceae bacterium]|nr:hypothetical protein [Lachnospiraceae bacterium]